MRSTDRKILIAKVVKIKSGKMYCGSCPRLTGRRCLFFSKRTKNGNRPRRLPECIAGEKNMLDVDEKGKACVEFEDLP